MLTVKLFAQASDVWPVRILAKFRQNQFFIKLSPLSVHGIHQVQNLTHAFPVQMRSRLNYFQYSPKFFKIISFVGNQPSLKEWDDL